MLAYRFPYQGSTGSSWGGLSLQKICLAMRGGGWGWMCNGRSMQENNQGICGTPKQYPSPPENRQPFYSSICEQVRGTYCQPVVVSYSQAPIRYPEYHSKPGIKTSAE